MMLISLLCALFIEVLYCVRENENGRSFQSSSNPDGSKAKPAKNCFSSFFNLVVDGLLLFHFVVCTNI
jgi:hypothetical protein